VTHSAAAGGPRFVIVGRVRRPHGVLGAVAVGLASINVAGGFLVTQRMLEMFKKKAPKVGGKAEKQ